jgi:glutathione S-transferase
MITVHHLTEGRSQRVLWLLEELGLPYEIKLYQRDPKTRHGSPELQKVHPLGKSPIITDGDRTIIESGAILDYLIRRHGGGKLQPDPASDAYDTYVQWLHYAEGSAMVPLLLLLYTQGLGKAAAPLQPRIDAEISNHLGYVDRSLSGRHFLVGDDLTGADVQMIFVAEAGRVLGQLDPYPALSAWLDRLHARPAYQRALERGGPATPRVLPLP